MLRDIYSIFLDECDVCWSERDSDQNTWSQKNSDGLFMEKKTDNHTEICGIIFNFSIFKKRTLFYNRKKNIYTKKVLPDHTFLTRPAVNNCCLVVKKTTIYDLFLCVNCHPKSASLSAVLFLSTRIRTRIIRSKNQT
jgi:hypothetical protein